MSRLTPAATHFEIKAHAADEAGKFIALGRMTNQSRRFVDDQQSGVFVDDVEHKVFLTRIARIGTNFLFFIRVNQ